MGLRRQTGDQERTGKDREGQGRMGKDGEGRGRTREGRGRTREGRGRTREGRGRTRKDMGRTREGHGRTREGHWNAEERQGQAEPGPTSLAPPSARTPIPQHENANPNLAARLYIKVDHSRVVSPTNHLPKSPLSVCFPLPLSLSLTLTLFLPLQRPSIAPCRATIRFSRQNKQHSSASLSLS